eukprot:9357-Heterococcus_DN1.PRE.1
MSQIQGAFKAACATAMSTVFNQHERTLLLLSRHAQDQAIALNQHRTLRRLELDDPKRSTLTNAAKQPR